MIELDGHTLTTPQVWRLAHRLDTCRVADAARVRMRESRALVEQSAAEPRAIYGINTGFGPLSGERVRPADLEQHQLNLLHHLSVGQGPLFDRRETRAIMVARSNALARGFSGIREEVVDLLLTLLDHDLLPEIPSLGSVGASGDLAPLAHMARVLVGQGLPPLLTGAHPGLNSGFAGGQLLSTALAAECRVLATPASVQSIPTNANNQDVVSMGTIAARLTRQVIDKVWTVAAVLAMALAQAADLRRGVMGTRLQEFHARQRLVSPALVEDRPLDEEIRAVTDLLRTDQMQSDFLSPRPPPPA